MNQLITAAMLKSLAAAGSVRAVTAVPIGKVFAVRATVDTGERTLRPAHHDKVRTFTSLMAIARFVHHDLQFPEMTVQLSNWHPQQHRADL